MANVSFTYNPVPSPACYPPDMNGLAQELTTGGVLVGTIPDTAGGGVTVGSSPPSSALTNKVWFKTDAAGRPLGVFMFYNGNWRKVYTGLAQGEIRLWSGPLSAFDNNHYGVVGGDLDGWVLCDSTGHSVYGAPNLEGAFVAGATYGTANDGTGQVGWITDADGTFRTGGGAKGPRYIGIANLPGLHTVGFQRVITQGTGGGIGVLVPDSTQPHFDMQVASGPSDTPPGGQPFPFPLYYAIAYIWFFGYQ